jgi:orotate phosphoribosyltransferase
MAVLAATEQEADQLLQSCGALEFGHYLLSSGLHSDRYVQVARVSEDPRMLEQVGQKVGAVCAQYGASLVVSPALGAVLFGHELARALGVRHAFAERPEGKFELRRGFVVEPGERVLLAENVITTGGSVLEVADLIRQLDGVIVGFASVIDRSNGRFDPQEPHVTFAQVEAPTYDPKTCPLCAQGIPMTKPGSRTRFRIS